jgi:Zn-dependent M28 family amino/carboxypeptidase
MGPRWVGTPEDLEARQYIAGVFESIGYTAEILPFTAFDEYEEEYVDSANVSAVKAGRSPLEIIVGAHFDSSDEGDGVDDNASGVAALLAVAEMVYPVDTPYTIRFIAFSGEEAGFLGSTVYVEQMDAGERANVVAMVNLDCLVAGDIPYIYSDEGADAAARDWILAWAGANGYPLQTIPNVDLTDEDDGYGTSDYDPFRAAGIPWVYFEATNWNLGDQDGYTQVDERFGDDGAIIHTEYDTLEYLDSTFPGRVDERFDLFTTVLYTFLTQYQAPQ